MSDKHKRYLFFGILGVCCIVTIILIVNMIASLVQYNEAKEEYDAITSTAIETVPTKKQVTIYTGTATTEVTQSVNPDVAAYEMPDITVDFKSLMEANKDCVGWIYVPGTKINYPIVQSSDNIDYINTTFTGKENIAGCIFSDCRILSPFSQKTILYGHNMKNGTMFHDLFTIESNPDELNAIWIFLPGGTMYHYTVTGTKRTDMLDKDIYSISATYSDELVLSTCIKNETRLVVTAKRDWYHFN